MKYLLLCLLITACASKPSKDPGASSANSKRVSMESKQLASEEESTFVTEIGFPKKGVDISSSAKQELKKLYQEAKTKGEIDKVKVISWADMEYPSVHEKKLSEDQMRLARSRNETIERYLESINEDLNVEKISMAERPGKLEELTGTDGAEEKRSLETSGLPNTDTTVKVPGKASKSIVIFTLKR